MANPIRRIPNVTRRRTAKVARLEFEIANQTTLVAQTTAKNQGLQNKLKTFTALLNEKQALLEIAQTNFNQFLVIEGRVLSVTNTTDTSSSVSQNTYALAKGMLEEWQKVGQAALTAATEIAELTTYVQRRKANNPLINDDLVNMAVDANNTARASVQRVITALVEAMAAVNMASQASQTTSLTVLYAQLAQSYAIGNNDNDLDASSPQDSLNKALQQATSKNSLLDNKPLRQLVTQSLTMAQNDVAAYKKAVKTISGQAATAQTEMAAAQQELAALQQALAAAQTALLLNPAAAPAEA